MAMIANRIAATPRSARTVQFPIRIAAIAVLPRTPAIEDCAKIGPLSSKYCPTGHGRSGIGGWHVSENPAISVIAAGCEAAVGLISEATMALVDGIAAESTRFETPCGDGTMVWRCWGGGRPLVLLHGGYGSWTHWVRNVLPLSRDFRVIAADLPGLGESATPPEPWTAAGLAAIIVQGLDIVVPRAERMHLAGFSFGGVIGGNVAAQLGDRRSE